MSGKSEQWKRKIGMYQLIVVVVPVIVGLIGCKVDLEVK